MSDWPEGNTKDGKYDFLSPMLVNYHDSWGLNNSQRALMTIGDRLERTIRMTNDEHHMLRGMGGQLDVQIVPPELSEITSIIQLTDLVEI